MNASRDSSLPNMSALSHTFKDSIAEINFSPLINKVDHNDMQTTFELIDQ
jgi:hypothetical protein